MTVSVLLVDDHPMIRQGLRNLLSGVSDFHIIGEASDGIEAIHKIELTKPNILVLDLMMTNLNGLEVLSQVKKLSPATHTIVFSMQSADAYIVEALRAGAAGYVLKDTGPAEIVAAIHSVLQGNRYLSERLSERLEAAELRVEDAPLDLYQTLTTREREILQMVAEGRSSIEIGDKLVISPRTVEIHRSKLMKKLGLRNQAELIRYTIKRGILSIDN
jgi:two-component system, NarL family, response regulator NreC